MYLHIGRNMTNLNKFNEEIRTFLLDGEEMEFEKYKTFELLDMFEYEVRSFRRPIPHSVELDNEDISYKFQIEKFEL